MSNYWIKKSTQDDLEHLLANAVKEGRTEDIIILKATLVKNELGCDAFCEKNQTGMTGVMFCKGTGNTRVHNEMFLDMSWEAIAVIVKANFISQALIPPKVSQ